MSQLRQERVANGSRRKRDLAAAGKQVTAKREENEAWAAKHLPGENHYVVTAACLRLRNQGKPETAENIREYLRGRGWLREQNS